MKDFAAASDIGDPATLNREAMNKLLCMFVIQLKKADGTEHETSSMHSAISILSRHVREIGKVDLEKDSEYQGFRDVKRAKTKLLKPAGKGTRPNQALPISGVEEQKINDAGQLGLTSPDALQ